MKDRGDGTWADSLSAQSAYADFLPLISNRPHTCAGTTVAGEPS